MLGETGINEQSTTLHQHVQRCVGRAIFFSGGGCSVRVSCWLSLRTKQLIPAFVSRALLNNQENQLRSLSFHCG